MSLRGFSRSLEQWIQVPHFYGAAGIVAFGWALCRLLAIDPAPWMPLWLCAALFVYNVDRIRHDPADAVNTPERQKAARRLRPLSWTLALGSGAALVLIPLLRRDWITIAAALAGSAVCLNYSVPVRGFRLKEVPLLKTFFAPTIVIAAIVGLPALHNLRLSPPFTTPIAVLWAWTVLFCNMVLCDLRDVRGDRRTGVTSIPSHFGPKRTRQLLDALILTATAVSFLLTLVRPTPGHLRWFSVGVCTSVYLACIVRAARKRRSERFYEWWVEGILYVPAIALILVGEAD